MGKKINFITLSLLVVVILLYGTEYQVLTNTNNIDSLTSIPSIISPNVLYIKAKKKPSFKLGIF